mmetsp:Transcript_14514/g.46506  ORF Transcript_14514/g.46506 Transcript_14514/m.46506 type:complete len:777 (+) Transcript_14514:1082-3412(+)
MEADPDRKRAVVLSDAALEQLRADDGRLMEKLEQLSPAASITVRDADSGGSEVLIDSSMPGAARRAELCLRSILASLAGQALEMRVLPEGDGQLLEVLEVPEAAAGSIQPRALLEEFGVVAAFAREKERVRPRPKAEPGQVELGKALGLAVGQAVEVRYEDSWFHASVRGFSAEGTVLVEWLGGGEAELPAVDVRPSRRNPASQAPRPAPTHGCLVLIGELRPRTTAKLRAMSLVDCRISGHFAERFPPQPSGALFGFDIAVLPLPPSDGGACARQRSKIAAASEATVEVLGRRALVAGDGDERRRAGALLTQLVPQAGPFGDAAEIPEELGECCSLLRVPPAAVSAVAGVDRAALSRMEETAGCLAFWLPLGTAVRPRGEAGAAAATTAPPAGTKVWARYEGTLFGAVVAGAGESGGRVRITWDFDGSEEDVAVSELQLSSASQKKRDQWLQKPRVLAIIGPERSRRLCAMLVMEAAEAACPGLWTGSLTDAVSELRDGRPEDEVLCGAEAAPHEGPAQELEWFRGPQGQEALQSAQGAAPCLIRLVGRVFFLAGYADQRARGREYLDWACRSRQGAAGPAGARAGGRLSVVDADMREDVTVALLPEAQAVWLRPDRLRAVERETDTLLLFDDGGGSALAPGTRRLLLCGWSEPQRRRALQRAEALGREGASIAAAAAPAAGRAETAPAPEQPAARRAAPPPQAAGGKSDPRAVLKTIPWPATINQWGTLQKTVWAGHPKLAAGWIRVWSRSQDSEYYLRLKDMKTTFELGDVLA